MITPTLGPDERFVDNYIALLTVYLPSSVAGAVLGFVACFAYDWCGGLVPGTTADYFATRGFFWMVLAASLWVAATVLVYWQGRRMISYLLPVKK